MASRSSASINRWRKHAVRQMGAVRRSTLAFIDQLPQQEILRPRTQDSWSVKDVLGHLLTCDEETVRRLQLIARGRGDRIKWFESMAYADRFNTREVRRVPRYGLATVLRRMTRVRADLIKRFHRLPAAALHDPSHAYTVVSWLPVPGWTHERDHVNEVRHWWREQRRQLRAR